MSRRIVLENIHYLNGKEFELESGNLVLNDGPAVTQIVADCRGYIALPSFVNAYAETFKKSLVQQGFTINITFDSADPTAVDIRKNGWNISKINDFQYSLVKNGTRKTIDSIELKDFYGSGNLEHHSSNIWPLLLARAARQNDCKELLRQLTIAPAEILGLGDTFINDSKANSNVILFKVLPQWDLATTESILKSIFLHGGNDNKVAAAFKDGQLLYGQDEFTDIYQAASLSMYYDQENDPSRAVGGEKHEFDSIESALEDFKKGNFVVVVDNEDRENEGDLIIAGEDFTPEKAAFMIRYTTGLICAPATGAILDRLKLPLMVEKNTDSLKTAYTISIDATKGTTTGISAHDRSTTIRLLSTPDCQPESFNRPGHVFPLRAVEGGVLKRVGHTEASVDLCRLAGKAPVAAICEICLDNGKMARRDDLIVFCKRWNFKLITINDLVNYRVKHGL
ncbi:hypothetical protein HDV01_007866 [Terramyces sp. JEL0728]|nr:hypothetical protein HDV01_007866 [Terramyces sp. JEL0728]